MKKKLYFLTIFTLLICGCGSTQKTDSTPTPCPVTTNPPVVSTELPKASFPTSLSVIFETLTLQIPTDWAMRSNISYEKGTKQQLYLSSNPFNEEELKEEAEYTTTEECINEFVLNGTYLDDSSKKTYQVGDYIIYQYHATADKWDASLENATPSDDPLIFSLLIDSKHQMLYQFIFQDEMATDANAEQFMKQITTAKERTPSNDGLYRWQIEWDS